MLRKYKKTVNKYFSNSRLVIFVCVILAVFLGISLVKEVVNRHQIDEKIKQYKIDVTKLEKENDEIAELIDSWTTSKQLEKEARLKFGLKKPGENVVLITRNNQINNNVISDDAEVLGGVVVANLNNYDPNYKKWWSYFFQNK